MCIGIPMQVESVSPGMALCMSRGAIQRVRTVLVGDDLAPGDWLLVFLDSAIELIDATRAHEINATLALLERCTETDVSQTEAAFALPSRMSRDELIALSTSH
ncbi:HypC/HybG/HupF family hydrogenase formation chaperone [Diaphorobacter sp. HDW4A]|nr:HypC/HybG/HupF family hydrogenase formation chaperone [Diaphorobacter sp. HDW4A]QIL79445.1 HypC/HybG/HupF family hydrogenase formation chaperone [Diaphorobacter sp. HDW4A]